MYHVELAIHISIANFRWQKDHVILAKMNKKRSLNGKQNKNWTETNTPNSDFTWQKNHVNPILHDGLACIFGITVLLILAAPVDFSLKKVCIQILIPMYWVPNVNQKLLNRDILGMGTAISSLRCHHVFFLHKWEWQWPPLHTSLQVHFLEPHSPKTPNCLQTPCSID